MKQNRLTLLFVSAVTVAALFQAACGKKKDKEDKGDEVKIVVPVTSVMIGCAGKPCVGTEAQ